MRLHRTFHTIDKDVSGEGHKPPSVNGNPPTAFDYASYLPVLRFHPGSFGLAPVGMAVSSNPQKTSSPCESLHNSAAVSFLLHLDDLSSSLK